MAKKAVKKMAKKAVEKKEIEITVQSSFDLPATRIYSNHVEITQSPNDFTLKFCDATPIYNIDEVLQNEGIHKIPVVAEIAIPFALMPKLIKALQTQHNTYKRLISTINGKNKK